MTLHDDALVVRGGAAHDPEILARAGETDADGTLLHLSVNSATGLELADLARYLPHNKIACTTIGQVRALGGRVDPTPTWNNPYHCDLSGITADQAGQLFGRPRDNPNPISARMPQGR